MKENTFLTCYQMISELSLNPQSRDETTPEKYRNQLNTLEDLPPRIVDELKCFLSEPSAFSIEEYVKTIELSPPCPFYLGDYLFDEPSNCRGMGVSNRNAYMIELINLYRHFACEFVGKELSDHLSVMVDFLWLSLKQKQHDSIGLRRRFVEYYLMPGLSPMLEKLKKYQSAYAHLVQALFFILGNDIKNMTAIPMWVPKERA